MHLLLFRLYSHTNTQCLDGSLANDEPVVVGSSLRSARRYLEEQLWSQTNNRGHGGGNSKDQINYIALIVALFTMFVAVVRRVLFLSAVVLPAAAAIIRIAVFVERRTRDICSTSDPGKVYTKALLFLIQCAAIRLTLFLFLSVYVPVIQLELSVLVSAASAFRHMF